MKHLVHVYTGDGRVLLDVRSFDMAWASEAFAADRARHGYVIVTTIVPEVLS